MSRNYSYPPRRSGGGWQWAIIGGILGFACAAVLAFLGIIFGVLNLSGTNIAFGVTNTPTIITATPPPATNTALPTEVTILPSPTATGGVAVAAPSTTPTLQATLPPTASPTIFPSPMPLNGPQAVVGAPDDLLLQVVSPSELLAIPGGQFVMGTTAAEVSAAVDFCVAEGGRCTVALGEDAFPQHTVTLSAYQMERTEVSYAQFLAFMNYLQQERGTANVHRNGCFGQPCLFTNLESQTSSVQYDSISYDVIDVISNLAVTEVTWFGARAYCEAIGRRLPTEAEWEFAARGASENGTGFIYPWGNEWDPTRASARVPDGQTPSSKVDVNSFPLGASPFGMLNMAGNVAEWVGDWYDARFYGRPEATAPDPVGPPSGTARVTRGGSWDARPFFARTMHRQEADPAEGTPFIGFRCASDAATAPVGNAQGTSLLPGAIGTPDPALLGVTATTAPANAAPTLPPRNPTATPPAARPSGAGTPTPTLASGA
jgi:formylglycine-generating enzyme required for sulfatase activity